MYQRRKRTCNQCGLDFSSAQKRAGHQRLMHSPWDSIRTDGRRKARLLKERGHRCEVCKGELWFDKPIPLHLDHIDGNPTNGNQENLRLICPNCHAQTETYCGRNIGRPKCLRREKAKYPSYRSKSWICNSMEQE